MDKNIRVYRNPILEYIVGHTSFENKGKAYRAKVIPTTKGGMI
jgi:hypothetical protein